MIGFSETSRWSINKALYGQEEAEKLATESYSKIKAKFADIEESFKNFDNLSFHDKIDLCYFLLDKPNDNFLRLKSIITPEARKFLSKGKKSSDNLRKIENTIKKHGDIPNLTEYNKIPIEEKISDCISLLYGADLFGIVAHIIINKDKEEFAELYNIKCNGAETIF